MRDPWRQLRTGFWATGLGTLASRALGMLRDVATASLLGLAAGGVMDALVLAFRIPNLLRRLLGEGALATSYLPVLTAELERDRSAAARLATTTIACLAAALTVVLVAAELACGLAWHFSSDPGTRLLLGLTAALLPYLWFICLAAQLSTTLHALSRFSVPALSAGLLNVCWLVGAWWLAPRVAATPEGQAYVLAGCILLAGALQVLVQLPALARLGLLGRFDWSASRTAGRKILGSMLPIGLALAVTQINTVVDSLVAWLLTAPTTGGSTIGWLPGAPAYPLAPGAIAALYYAERLYQLPVGLLGVSLATVIYPLLSRHAAAGRRACLATDVSFGLRLIGFTALPAAVGLMLVAEPLTRLLWEHGAFTAADSARTARTILAYAAGVWAYAALPVIARGFYALGDARRPLQIGCVAMLVNVVLDLTLVWPLGEAGLALATALAAAVQLGLLVWAFSRRHYRLDQRALLRSGLQTLTATAALGAAVLIAGGLLPHDPSRRGALVEVACAVVVGTLAYVLTARQLHSPELAALLPRLARRGSATSHVEVITTQITHREPPPHSNRPQPVREAA